ncbi:E3 ubiquitin-protein ligase TRIP12 [Cladophialophora psammophila CBS 110553]|uniref:HECT-type E3 ubiquitin transferase n=1 Tax=Cladophialophora psammophila CBS 110553 TaxID=1182543 RepID=W9X1Z1_9EURO|nr:E3 ubiquitin-protein ligase TRIP12 [Cladophialophora psammophila CBS 110553]EXJ70931.1 E3 ubiquitin-protein ligase TRIP12 [Cladophialophora psammophila CBS 110553]
MSRRVTRSSARLAAESGASTTSPAAPSNPSTAISIPNPPAAVSSRKRKAPARRPSSPTDHSEETSPPSARRGKRQKLIEPAQPQPTSAQPAPRSTRRRAAQNEVAMSNNGSSSKYTEESEKQLHSKSSSRRQSSRNNKTQDLSPPAPTSQPRRHRKRLTKKGQDVQMKDEEEDEKISTQEKDTVPLAHHSNSDSNDGDDHTDMDDDDGPDPFSAALFGAGRGPSSGLSSTLRALSGMMSGMSSRLREILNNLRQSDNPTMQMVALEELSNLLLVSNEDNLSGQFSPDPYVKELVALMQPNPITGEENPEMMLLACRCIANLMEALRGSVANVVYGGAVPVLCQKLLDIQYIDVAEQALSTLSKVSIDFPGSIVREGGLTACLQFLDFFATGTQRTAVTTAANCCRNIPHDSFPVIRDVMPILLNVLSSHDQKVVEQGCLCVTRVIDSFKHSPDKLEQLVDPPLLRAILGLLLPGTTNLIGANIHTEFLRVLAIVARASPRLSAELLKMNVVDTLYQILTGVSPPTETDDAASKIDSVVIMQALIHRPREQIYETLNVICELLPSPNLSSETDFEVCEDLDDYMSDDGSQQPAQQSKTEKRLELLADCKQETRRFATILLPTLTDAYSSTVNLSVRQKVLIAQLKILSNLETSVIEEALRPVPYASFLASILSQEDHPSLVMFALQASELLFERLEDIYQYQFHREGVIGEIKKLADRPLEIDAKSSKSSDPAGRISAVGDNRTHAALGNNQRDRRADNDDNDDVDDGEGDEEDGEDHEDDDPEDEDHDEIREDDDEEDDEIGGRDHDHGLDDSQSSDSSDDDDDDDDEVPSPLAIAGAADLVVMRAKKFLEKYDTPKGRELKDKASKIRSDLHKLANNIETFYRQPNQVDADDNLFIRLANYFDGDALESITSSELLDSGIIRVLVQALSEVPSAYSTARAHLVAAFMESTYRGNIKTTSATSAATPFSVLIQKLQDLLSRAEHFEVLTVNNNASESSRSSSTSMLSRQLRLKLSADADSDIPPTYRDMVVSIHAIATFRALDDYLRPRISQSERPASAQRRRDMLQQLANARLAHLSGAAESGLLSPFGQELSSPAPPGRIDSRAESRVSGRTKQRSEERQNPVDRKPTEKPERKRLTRRTQASSSNQPPAPEPSTEDTSNKLECADEKVLEDVEAPDAEDHGALEAFVDGLEEDVSDGEAPEPGAVNMEIGSSGKVTARKEDGTRVLTPQPGTPVPGSTRPSSGQSPGPSPAGPGGRPSYAQALASVPQDWHIEFSIDGKIIPNNTTIYRAVHHNRDQPQVPASRSVWSGVHTVKFRKVRGPPPTSSTISTWDEGESRGSKNGLPASFSGHPVTSSILALLRILHELNANLDELRDFIGQPGLKLYPESLASFINTKLTAKMNRQLEEPLIVASNCLPDWSEDLARSFPFLFPFETRHLFLQSTSFGYSRSMIRWQNSQSENDDRRDRRRDDRPMLGRPQRQKVRISRHRILESGMKVMDMYGASPSVLEVEYFEEVGTGLGPTLEFYSTVSKEFCKKKLKMWRENDSADNDQFAFGKNGLFPTPMSAEESQSEAGKKLLLLFKTLGKFVARSMLDSRIIDIAFSPTFFKMGGVSNAAPSVGLLRTIDQDLANSLSQLQQFLKAKTKIELDSCMTEIEKARAIEQLTIHGAKVEDLMLDFTLPGYPGIELIPNGSNVTVTMENIQQYIERVLDLSLGSGVRAQIEAFQSGFSQVFSYSSLRAFTPDELVMLFGRTEEDWSIETLMDSVKADHGYNMDSRSVKSLLQTMSELTPAQRRDFLQFVTGSPKLPIGGFKSLTPMFTVVCKPSEPPYTSDDYLPSVMTCVNYLKLPDYTSQKVLKERLFVAIREGQGAFHLS